MQGVKNLARIRKTIKDLLFFREPKKREHFILIDNAYGRKKESNAKHKYKQKGKIKKDTLQNLFTGDSEKNKSSKTAENNEKRAGKGEKISKDIFANLEYMKKVYNIPINGDVIIREFYINVDGKVVATFIIFIDGLIDRTVINDSILKPLMLLSNMDINKKNENIGEYVKNHLLPQNQLKITDEYRTVIDEINFGGCGIFVDGSSIAFAADVKGWEHRGVERPNTEIVLRGPQEGFTEVLRVNTALVRKTLKDEDLIIESLEIGERSKTACVMMYIKDITNGSLVDEVRKRLKSIKIDYLIDSGELEQLMEDSTFLLAPQVIATERPDKAASLLSEGRVAVIVNGSPFALIVPATFMGLIHSPEDSYVRFPYANFMRFVRITGIFLTLLLPALYIAITNFHHEMIPTPLLLAIESSREKLPFPSIVELIIMEVAFELIREAGIRIPGPIGPTLGIIGALILGQAAVAANIVSPILIIIVAVTGIGSFAVPNYSLAFSFRVLRFAYIIFGAMAGFLGVTAGVFIHSLFLVSAKSFGVPFMTPFGPITANVLNDEITRAPIWRQENRPDFLEVKDTEKQPHISRGWRRNGKGGKNEK
jgi:spore germination protein KA